MAYGKKPSKPAKGSKPPKKRADGDHGQKPPTDAEPMRQHYKLACPSM